MRQLLDFAEDYSSRRDLVLPQWMVIPALLFIAMGSWFAMSRGVTMVRFSKFRRPALSRIILLLRFLVGGAALVVLGPLLFWDSFYYFRGLATEDLSAWDHLTLVYTWPRPNRVIPLAAIDRFECIEVGREVSHYSGRVYPIYRLRLLVGSLTAESNAFRRGLDADRTLRSIEERIASFQAKSSQR